MTIGNVSHLNETWEEYLHPPKTKPGRVPIPEKNLYTHQYDTENAKMLELIRPFKLVRGSGKREVKKPKEEDYDELEGGCAISGGSAGVSAVLVMEGLEKSGLLQGISDTVGSLTRKLDWTLRNPASAKKFRITSNTLPNLQFSYDRDANFLTVKGDKLKDFRKDNIRLRMLNTEAKIKRELAKISALDLSNIDMDIPVETVEEGGNCGKRNPTEAPYSCLRKGIAIGDSSGAVPINKLINDGLKALLAQYDVPGYRGMGRNELLAELTRRGIKTVKIKGFRDPALPKLAPKRNPWLLHVQTVKTANPKMAYKDVLVKAKGSYKK